MKTTNYNIRLDKQLKESAFSVFESYGLTPSQAIKLFLNQVSKTQVIPLSFDWKQEKNPTAETKSNIASKGRAHKSKALQQCGRGYLGNEKNSR